MRLHKKNFENIIDKVYVKKNLSQFDPRAAVNKSLPENGDRRCNRAGSGPQHFYFKGIFPEAGEATEENVGESV